MILKIDDFKKNKNVSLFALLNAFIEAGRIGAKIQGAADHYATANSAQTALTSAIHRYNIGITAIIIKGGIYLVRTGRG